MTPRKDDNVQFTTIPLKALINFELDIILYTLKTDYFAISTKVTHTGIISIKPSKTTISSTLLIR